MCLTNREQESTDSGDQPVRVGPGAGRDFRIFFGLGPVRSEIFKNVLVLVRPGPGFLILFGPGPGLLGPNGFGPWISEGELFIGKRFLLGPSPENSRKLHGIANFRHSQVKLQTFSA